MTTLILVASLNLVTIEKYIENRSTEELVNPIGKYLLIQRSSPEDEYEINRYTILYLKSTWILVKNTRCMSNFVKISLKFAIIQSI
jgi:hypothetical protein